MPQYNNSIEKAVKILSLFTLSKARWKSSEVSQTLGMSSTTAYNILITLEKTGLLKKNDKDQMYELGKKLGSLGAMMAANSELNQKAAGLIQQLCSSHKVSSRLGIWDNDAVIIIYSGSPVNVPQQPSYQAGPRIVAYSTAIGRAILAYTDDDAVREYLNRINLVKYTSKTKINISEILKELDETRKRGYSICDEEMVYGGAALGAPLFDGSNHIVGALSIMGTTNQILGSEENNLINGLRSKALQISQNLGYGAY